MDYIRVAEHPLTEETIEKWRKDLQEAKNKGASHAEAVDLVALLGNLYYYYSNTLADNDGLNKVFIYAIQSYEEIPKGWNVPEEKRCDGFYLIDTETAKHKKIRILCNTVTKFTNLHILS